MANTGGCFSEQSFRRSTRVCPQRRGCAQRAIRVAPGAWTLPPDDDTTGDGPGRITVPRDARAGSRTFSLVRPSQADGLPIGTHSERIVLGMPGRDPRLRRRPSHPAVLRPAQVPRQHHEGADQDQTPGESARREGIDHTERGAERPESQQGEPPLGCRHRSIVTPMDVGRGDRSRAIK